MRKWYVFPLLALVCLVLGLPGAAFGAAKEKTLVKMETSMGDIVLELYPDKAPRTVANFLNYVKSGAYDGTIFHRVISNFMIQGGGFEPTMKERKTNAPIRNEADNGLQNSIYTIAMARTNEPHSATNQFFINVKDNAFLNHTAKTGQGWGYAVFGKVVDGMQVVDAIRKVATGNRGMHQDVPLKPVMITKAYVLKLR